MAKQKNMRTLQQRKGRLGYVFIIPSLFGLLFLFLIPLMQSVQFSFSNVTRSQSGFHTTFVWFQNFYDALFVETIYREKVVSSLLNTLLDVPLVTVFSFFIANLLNQKFPGRGFVRVIFFLPLILSSTALMSFDSTDLLQSTMGAGGGFKDSNALLGGFESSNLGLLMTSSGLPQNVVDYLMTAADRIYQIIILSGVQILLFLAGLQSIPHSVYEAASIEGASAWESFWKVTFPMISPIIFTSVIYTIIDSFTRTTNETLTIIYDTAFSEGQRFGLSSAMSWIYTLLIIVLLLIVFGFRGAFARVRRKGEGI